MDAIDFSLRAEITYILLHRTVIIKKTDHKGVFHMDINIREAIYQNVKDNSLDQFEETIVDALEDGEEKILPGLGVLFEYIWNGSTNEEKSSMLFALERGLQKHN